MSDAALVDAVAEDDREQDAEDGAEPTRRGVAAGVERGQEEHDRLEAFAKHGEKGHHHQGLGRALGQGRPGLLLQIALEIAGVPAHPQDHVGDHRHGDGADDGLEPLLLALGQVLRDELEQHADGHADGHRDRHADPDLPQSIAPALLAEEGRHDAHDQGRFHALSEPNDEGR